MNFDFTPDPKVLLALTHTMMRPIDALCELIDNAIDSFEHAKIEGVEIEQPMIVVELPQRRSLASREGVLRITDNGPGMTLEQAERSIKAGYSGNNPYDSLGLFGMGFNISTGKLGNRTILATARKGAAKYIRTVINLEQINRSKSYSLPVEEVEKDDRDAYFQKPESCGTIIEVSDWWAQGNANYRFVDDLVKHGMPKIREEIGRRYATILRTSNIRIILNGEPCEPFFHCHWGEQRYVERKEGRVPAYIALDKTLGSVRKCSKCTAVIPDGDDKCPVCGSREIRTVAQRVYGWVGIQRFDHETNFGIDLIRNGRAIRIGEKGAFFTFVDELKREIKDYPIDQQYGRIIGEVHLDFVPVDFMKQDFIRTSVEWEAAMAYLRGETSFQPQRAAGPNDSPVCRLYRGYRRVRSFGPGDLYMGYWDQTSRKPARISRETEEEYYQRFLRREAGFFDDTEWYKLVEGAVQEPAPELKECPDCGMQNAPDAEVCTGCNHVFDGKTCVNPDCHATIPRSAESCPLCGKSQVVKVSEPWVCEVCGGRNRPEDSTCAKCNSPKGAKDPFSRERLLAESDKADGLSATKFSVRLADGQMSSPVGFSVYLVRTPLVKPGMAEGLPVLTFRSLDSLDIFLDPRHSLFTRCETVPELVVAEEVAHYIYDFHRALASHPEHSITPLTWAVVKKQWYDSLCVSPQKIRDQVKEVMDDIRARMIDGMGDLPQCFDILSAEEKRYMANALTANDMNLDAVAALKQSGEYIRYVPDSFIYELFKQSPESFFDGGVFASGVKADVTSELLGSELVGDLHKRSIRQIQNNLERIAIFTASQTRVDEGKADVTVLNQVRLAATALSQRMN